MHYLFQRKNSPVPIDLNGSWEELLSTCSVEHRVSPPAWWGTPLTASLPFTAVRCLQIQAVATNSGCCREDPQAGGSVAFTTLGHRTTTTTSGYASSAEIWKREKFPQVILWRLKANSSEVNNSDLEALNTDPCRSCLWENFLKLNFTALGPAHCSVKCSYPGLIEKGETLRVSTSVGLNPGITGVT